MLDNKYMPNINVINGAIRSVQFNVDNIICTIQEQIDNTCPEDIFHIVTETERNLYEEADRKIYEWLVNPSHLSQMNSKTLEIEKEYPIRAINGYLTDDFNPDNFNAIDYNKSYTSCVMGMQYFPKFNVFDVFVKYDGHEIEDYRIYCGM